ncbi:hypothetical protein [Pseudomonas fulva]|nr:hypothetical protein [Pseudomonas fulva]MBF8778263.1 hypothetical protein [Pseudomonas fulva]
MADPRQTHSTPPPDPYVDEIPHNPGDKVPHPDDPAEEKGPDWPAGQVPPEEQSDG